MINKITFTGADDSTYIPNLLVLNKICSYVEWGILISKKITVHIGIHLKIF
jgi:hypothetical protein